MLGERHGVADRLVVRAAGDGDGLVEDGKTHRRQLRQSAAVLQQATKRRKPCPNRNPFRRSSGLTTSPSGSGTTQKSKAFYSQAVRVPGVRDLGRVSATRSAGPTARPATGSRRPRAASSTSIGDVGFHHYAFELRNRKDVDALQAFLEKEKVKIVDPADEYYEDYYAVFFLDPDGLKLEGMKYGELTAKKKKGKTSKSKG